MCGALLAYLGEEVTRGSGVPDTIDRVRSFLLTVGLLLATASVAAAYDEVAVEGGGVISGRVGFGGDVPAATFLPVLQNGDVCGERVRDESLIVSPSGDLAGVVVELRGVAAGKPRSDVPAVLDNERCSFVPRIQALVVGQSLEIRNSDPLLHDAHAWMGSRTIFNLGLPRWRVVSHVFDEPGLLSVDCNILHTWMKAWIFVSEHPYIAVTDRTGRFSITDVPIGTYELRIWHETLGEKMRDVDVEEDQRVELELVLP